MVAVIKATTTAPAPQQDGDAVVIGRQWRDEQADFILEQEEPDSAALLAQDLDQDVEMPLSAEQQQALLVDIVVDDQSLPSDEQPNDNHAVFTQQSLAPLPTAVASAPINSQPSSATPSAQLMPPQADAVNVPTPLKGDPVTVASEPPPPLIEPLLTGQGTMPLIPVTPPAQQEGPLVTTPESGQLASPLAAVIKVSNDSGQQPVTPLAGAELPLPVNPASADKSLVASVVAPVADAGQRQASPAVTALADSSVALMSANLSGVAPQPHAEGQNWQWQAPSLAKLPPQQWGQQLVQVLGDKVQLQVGHKIQQAHVRLDPPNLGTVEIKIRMEGEHTSVQLSASHPQIRESMQQQLEQLRQQLGQQLSGKVEVAFNQDNQQSGHRQQHSRPYLPQQQQAVASNDLSHGLASRPQQTPQSGANLVNRLV